MQAAGRLYGEDAVAWLDSGRTWGRNLRAQGFELMFTYGDIKILYSASVLIMEILIGHGNLFCF